MWRCPGCGEEIEDSFDACWKCGTGQDGVPAEHFQPESDDSWLTTSEPEQPIPEPSVNEPKLTTAIPLGGDGPRNTRYQFTLRSLLLAMTLLCIAFGLFRVAFSTDLPRVIQILAFVSGLLLCGGIASASIGHAYSIQHGSMARQESTFLGSTIAAMVILLFFYPMSLAPTGPLTNGGALGLGFLVIASALAWRAFLLNRRNPWLRRIVQLPLTGVATYLAIAEAVVQCYAGHCLWF